MGLLTTISKEIHREQYVREMNHLGAQDINSKNYIWFKKKDCRQYCRDMCKKYGYQVKKKIQKSKRQKIQTLAQCHRHKNRTIVV